MSGRVHTTCDVFSSAWLWGAPSIRSPVRSRPARRPAPGSRRKRLSARRWRARRNAAGALFRPLVCTENLDSDVLMMQPVDQGIRHNASDPLNWARDRRILSQGAMSSRRVVIARIRFYESAQVLLTQCDDMVNTLASDRPNQPFHEAILPRRARLNRLVADTHGS